MSEDTKFSLKEDVARMAQSDTPEQVQVRDNYISLVIWATGRFGIAIVAFYGMYLIYGDLKANYERDTQSREKTLQVVIEALKASTVSQMQVSSALQTNNDATVKLQFALDQYGKILDRLELKLNNHGIKPN